ncbi:MAG TPA: FAD-binding oxidoreductase [Lysobacter sp.]
MAADRLPDRDRRRFLHVLAVAAAAAGTGCGLDAGEADTVEDVARIARTRVSAVAVPRSTQQVAQLLADSEGAVSIGGARFSMGGQVAAPGSLHLDMRSLDRLLWLDAARRRVRVQAGMRWRDLQDHIDPHGLAVKVMQSYSNFSVGGSVSVNCHGRYVGRGALVNTIRALRLVTAQGEVLDVDRQAQPSLFAAAIGGYGGIGVVTEVELDLDRNEPMRREAERVGLSEYPAWFAERVAGDAGVILHNADLLPPDFDRPLAISWRRTDQVPTVPARLVPRGGDYDREQNLTWATSELPLGDDVRDRFLTRRLLDEHPVVWRNHEASLDAASLEPRTRAFSTYLLQEYFIPVAAFGSFAREMARILAAHEVNALNVSIRHAGADTTSLLAWAREEVFSFVLYHKQRQGLAADARAGAWTRRLIDAALAHGGTYYLPYRVHATPEQFRNAYPAVDAFAATKREVDPRQRLRNRLWDRYLPA